MVEKKKPAKKKTQTRIKASTGAWWKSTVIEEEEVLTAEKPEEKKASAKTSSSKSKKTSSKSTAKSSTKKTPTKSGTSKKSSSSKKYPVAPKAADEKDEGQTSESAKTVEEADSPKAELAEEVIESPQAAAEPENEVQFEPLAEDKPEKADEPATDDKESVSAASPDKTTSSKSSSASKKSKRSRKSSSRKTTPKAPKKKESHGPSAKETTPTDSKTADLSGDHDLADEDLPIDDDYDEEKETTVLKLLINAEEPEESRLALLENGRLESIHVSTINRTQTKNNIYKGRVVAIEPNLQAAFVDYGTDKNGFLPFSEIHPEYYKQDISSDVQKLVDKKHWKKLSITDVLEKGQELLVQVVKEEVGNKGANMTTYLSLPGRSVVLMPGSDSSGISRKISGEERRSKLRIAMQTLNIPEGIGWIVRTAGVDITETALSRDVGYLLRLWEEIRKKGQELTGAGQVYEDHHSVLRFLREHFDPAIEEILVDDKEAMEQVKEFISLLPSKQRDVKVRLHKGSRPIFNQFSVEDQIESIYQPRVNLPSGGSIVIEPTEALVAVDVNSGSTSKGKNFEESIFQANLEAASEVARQLRLRDLGGLVIVDFIDMRNKKHVRDVERRIKYAMKRDKAKVDFSRISKFGLMQISRQKLGSPIEAGNYRVCEHCKGRGTVRSIETLALFYLRRIQTGASRNHVAKVECRLPLDVAQYLLNQKRSELQEHESRYKTEIAIVPVPSMSPIDNDIILHKVEKETNGKK